MLALWTSEILPQKTPRRVDFLQRNPDRGSKSRPARQTGTSILFLLILLVLSRLFSISPYMCCILGIIGNIREHDNG
jgi:hypothetical protein